MHFFRRYRVSLLSGALSLGTIIMAAAQDISTPALDPVMLGQGMTMNAAIQAQGEYLAAGKNRTATRSDSKSGASATRLTYSGTPALRQQIVRSAAAKLQATNPTQATALTAAFGPGKADYGQLYAAAIKGSGLRDNDAASAFAAYLEMGYAIANNLPDTRTISATMERGLRTQAAGLIGERLRSQAAVAQFGEEMKLQAVLLLLGWQSSQKAGPASAARYGRSVAERFRQSGLDMSLLRIDEQGLIRK
jgi:hypothetical protein